MAKKNARFVSGVIIFFFILLVISFSISFFLPVETKAEVSNDGHMEAFPNGKFKCIAPGSECSTGGAGIKPDIE